MEECPQCGKKLEIPLTRLVQDFCGHKKCRACLLEDETKCKQCNQLNLATSNSLIINCHTPVITFQSQAINAVKAKTIENPTKVNDNKTDDNPKKVEVKKVQRTHQTLAIPNHITVNETQPIYKCELCGKCFNTKSHVKYHQFCNGDKKPFKCDTCMKEFISKSHLEAHIILHNGIKEHVCDICKKSFAERSKLLRHRILHSDEKPFVCQECGKCFKCKESLRLHTRIHKGDKPFNCTQCNAKFNNSSNLKKHTVTHSKEKLHMCDQCGKRFKLKWALTVHHRTHLHLRPHKCSNCSKTFVNAKDLHRHELVHSDVRAYSCGVCATGFRRKDNLERHMKNTHPGKKVPPIKNTKSNCKSQTPVQQFVDNPNAIKVITAPPSNVNTITTHAPKTPVMNAPLKLAFKTSAFKNYYNIHRDYVPPSDETEPINIYQKILQPHSPPKSNDNNDEAPQELTTGNILSQYKNKPINYEASFEQISHADIKKIKFKLPAKYTSIKPAEQLFKINVPVPNEDRQENESNELRPAKTSVIVNTNIDLHWRRRTSQNLNIQNKMLDDNEII